MTVGRLLGWTGLLALGYAVVSLLVFLSQRSFIYFPKPAADSSGRLELQVHGQRVLVAHRPHPGPRALIYFGGNAEDVSLSRSALFAHVAERHSAVTVAGRSLGTGPAVHLAATQPVKRLVLLVPFDSLLAVARDTMPWLPVDLRLLDRWDAAAEAPLVRAPPHDRGGCRRSGRAHAPCRGPAPRLPARRGRAGSGARPRPQLADPQLGGLPRCPARPGTWPFPQPLAGAAGGAGRQT